MTDPKLNSDRRYELDWLRVIAILVLLFFHTGRIFDTELWHIKNDETTYSFNYWLPFIATWRMPLLFFISGAGSYFSFRKFTSLQFVTERFKRLIIPLLFGIVVVLPPQVYYEHKAEFNSFQDVYRSILNFIPYHDGYLNLYHLWFIWYLFIYSLLAIPVLAFLRSAQSDFFKNKILPFFYNPIILLAGPPILILITRLILLPEHEVRAHFAFYMSFFLFGLVYYCNSETRELIGKNRKYLLFASLLMLIPYFLSDGFRETSYSFSAVTIQAVFVGWFWVITLIAYGQHYLNHSHPWLTIINEGIYPFYILHQTVIVVVGYYICQLPWGITAKYWSINVLTLVFCAAFYLLCIRPFNFVRIPFGMKLKRHARAR